MPAFLEPRLRAAAIKRGFTSPRQQARYIYGAMNNMGAMHGNQITAKGERMEQKHEADMSASSQDEDETDNMRPPLQRSHPRRHLNLGKYLHPKGGY